MIKCGTLSSSVVYSNKSAIETTVENFRSPSKHEIAILKSCVCVSLGVRYKEVLLIFTANLLV